MAGNLYEQGYYETGTASVTQGQTVVTGQGTAWLQIVRPADDFGKHVGMPVPIASVDSDTQITLAYPWPGPTQTAEPYRISFTPYHVAYRQALQEIGQMLASGNVSALADLVGAAGTFPIFTGTGAMDLADLSDYAGNVVGPASSTDSNVALFDGTGGKLLKDGFPAGATGKLVLAAANTGEAQDAIGASTTGKSLLTAANASAARGALGLGSAATQATSAFATAAQGTKADNALPTSGGEMSAAIVMANARFYSAKTTEGDAKLVLGIWSDNNLYIGVADVPLQLRGSAARAKYNGSDLPLASDLQDTNSLNSFGFFRTSQALGWGDNTSGSNLLPFGADAGGGMSIGGANPTGTWKCLGHTSWAGEQGTLFVKVAE